MSLVLVILDAVSPIILGTSILVVLLAIAFTAFVLLSIIAYFKKRKMNDNNKIL